MAAQNGSNLGRLPPPLPSPSPSPDGHTAVIVIVFISLGSCLFFFAFVAAAICWFVKRRKMKSSPQEVAEVIRVDGHRKVHEDVVQDAHGQQAVVLTIEDDVHIDEIIKKKENRHGHSLHGKHEGGNSSPMEAASSSTSDSNVSHLKSFSSKDIAGYGI